MKTTTDIGKVLLGGVVIMVALTLALAVGAHTAVEDPGSGGTQAPCDGAHAGWVTYFDASTSYTPYGHQHYKCRFSDGWSMYSYSHNAYFGNYEGYGNYTPGWYMWWPYDCICYLG